MPGNTNRHLGPFCKRMSRAKNWCFTLNNYVDADQDRLRTLAASEQVAFLVFGREVGESGTPHLQGYIEFRVRKRLRQVKDLVGQRAHLEIRRGTGPEAREYCLKDGDFEEFGEMTQGWFLQPIIIFPMEMEEGG